MQATSVLEFVEYLRQRGVADRSTLLGCSEAEIAALEARYSLRLPAAYRAYLALMGHRSGRLFTHDHVAVFYRYVLTLTDDVRTEMASGEAVAPPSFSLPPDALLISARLGDQFQFIRCVGADDSPVWYFNRWEWKIVQCHASILEWLHTWCAEAERAIASGYFKQYPDGTTP